MMDDFQLINPDFREKLDAFKDAFFRKYANISETPTPEIDGSGNEVIKHRPDGMRYVEESWIRTSLDKYFPGWSWERAGGITFLGSEWVVADGVLTIVDEYLSAYGINPPVRRFWAADAVRIQYKKDMPHTPENIVDIGDNVQAANAGAFKRAANRLAHISDDIFGKQVQHEGSGTLETLFHQNPTLDNFMKLVSKIPGTWAAKMQLLGVSNVAEILDYREAWELLKNNR